MFFFLLFTARIILFKTKDDSQKPRFTRIEPLVRSQVVTKTIKQELWPEPSIHHFLFFKGTDTERTEK